MKKIPYGRQNIDQNDIDAVISTLQSNYLTQGPKVREFESEFARYVGNVSIAVLKKSGKIVIIPNFIESIDDFLSSSPEGKE